MNQGGRGDWASSLGGVPIVEAGSRPLGDEYIFQMVAMQNIESLDGLGVQKIITQCPHCFNALKNEDPQLGRPRAQSRCLERRIPTTCGDSCSPTDNPATDASDNLPSRLDNTLRHPGFHAEPATLSGGSVLACADFGLTQRIRQDPQRKSVSYLLLTSDPQAALRALDRGQWLMVEVASPTWKMPSAPREASLNLWDTKV